MSTQEKISHKELPWEEMTDEQKITFLSTELYKSQQLVLTQGDRLKAVYERLESVLPVYTKLYKKWWIRWFFAPYDAALEGKKLMRCATCGGLFLLGGEKEFTAHFGHKYSVCRTYSLWEHIKLLAGRVR